MTSNFFDSNEKSYDPELRIEFGFLDLSLGVKNSSLLLTPWSPPQVQKIRCFLKRSEKLFSGDGEFGLFLRSAGKNFRGRSSTKGVKNEKMSGGRMMRNILSRPLCSNKKKIAQLQRWRIEAYFKKSQKSFLIKNKDMTLS